MVRRGKLTVFEGSNISEIEIATPAKITPAKIGVHAFDINPYLHDFFESVPID